MNIVRSTFLLAACLLLPAPFASAQAGRDSSLWSFTASSQHHNAIVSVSLDDGNGTGTIIAVNREKPVSDGYEGYCLTAYHVVQSDDDRRAIKVRYRNGRSSSRCKVVQTDADLDIAILWVWVPPEVEPVSLANESVQPGDALELAGLGGASDPELHLRTFSASASAPTDSQTIYADVSLLPGDSGGPVFNARHEVVGVISGGWFWWNGGVVTDGGMPITATWPARAANLEKIRELYQAAKPPEAEQGETLILSEG